MTDDAPQIGVLAIQGGFEAHERVLRRLGALVREVRVPADLDGIDGLVLPGGESTAISLGIEREGLAEPLRRVTSGERQAASGGEGMTSDYGKDAPGDDTGKGATREGTASGGVPVLGSCAGLILLDREHLGIMDLLARRNAFGRQVFSFEADLEIEGIAGPPLRGVFIRAPWIAEHGPGVEVLARVDGHPVAARQGRALAVAFHTELGSDDRLHQLFLKDVEAARRGSRALG
jgi:pyridoxal 5'-phosphate synthase pdxT subunit